MRADLIVEPALADGLGSTPAEPILAPMVSPPLEFTHALGVDLILEGFLAHHGTPRDLVLSETSDLVLAGDYCYAAGLVRVAQANDVFVIDALARLVALSAGLAATGRRAELSTVWLGTAAVIIRGADPRMRARFADAIRRASADEDPSGFAQLAAELRNPPDLESVFA